MSTISTTTVQADGDQESIEALKATIVFTERHAKIPDSSEFSAPEVPNASAYWLGKTPSGGECGLILKNSVGSNFTLRERMITLRPFTLRKGIVERVQPIFIPVSDMSKPAESVRGIPRLKKFSSNADELLIVQNAASLTMRANNSELSSLSYSCDKVEIVCTGLKPLGQDQPWKPGAVEKDLN